VAISLKTAGTWAGYIADGTVAIPGSPAAGDRMFLFATWKDFAITAAVSGWTAVGSEFADGSTTKGNGTGSMKVMAWYRDWQTGDTDPTIAFTTMAANDIAGAVIQLWQKASTEVWSTPLTVTGAMTNWTTSSQVFSASATVAVPSSGVVMGLVGIRDNSATMTRGATTGIDDSAAAITWAANYVESPATHFDTTTGFDMSADLGHRLVTTGGTVTLRMEGTISASETGAGKWVVQGVTVATNAAAENAAGTGAASGASETVAPTAEASAGTGTAYLAQASASTDALAESASGSGVAAGATTEVASVIAVATGSGSAATIAAAIELTAGNATGTAAALDATGAVNVSAGHAAGTAAASDVQLAIEVSAGVGTASGAAADAAVSVGVAVILASATGAASDATVSTDAGVSANAGAATGTGAASAPSAALEVSAELDTASGTAGAAAVSVGVATAMATATGAAADATVSVGGAGDVLVDAEAATGTGAAWDLGPAVAVAAAAALASGAALGPGIRGLIDAAPPLVAVWNAVAVISADHARPVGRAVHHLPRGD